MKVLSSEQWVESNFQGCDFGDTRRTNRLLKVASNTLAAPHESIPGQNLEWADTKAAYRFFANENVTVDKVAEQHWQQTRRTKPGRYLLICDTTDIDHSYHRATEGLGMLGDGDGRGMQLHSCLVYGCDDGQIHGTAGALVHYRVRKPKNETRMQRLDRHRDSCVWGNLVKQVGSAPEGSQWIHVWDRGGDNFEAMCHIRLTGNDWIIRAAKLNRNVFTEDDRKVTLGAALDEATPLGGYELSLRSRPGVEARTAKLDVSAVRVRIPRPTHQSKWVKQCGIDELAMSVVIVQETDAPKGVTPIRWVLLTSLPIKTFTDAWKMIEDYENRWYIEEYHKVLKSGCNVKGHALREASRLEPQIALISVIATRLFQLKLVGRNQPEAKAKTRVPSNWLKVLKLAKPRLKTSDMTVYKFFRELAKLGGFLGRNSDGEPGWQTIWQGYQKMQLLLDGMRLAGAI